MSRPYFAAAALAISVSHVAPALAQDLAAAEALFNRGLADMQAGKFDTACPALAESQRIDPRPGTLFTLAECENKAGKIATAVARYEDYLRAFSRLAPDQQAKQAGREKIAQEQKAALAPHVPLLTLTLPPGAPEGVIVKRDGAVVGGPSLGIALPVDPGEHVVTTQAPGGPVHEAKISIARDEKKAVQLEVKAGDPGAPPPLGAGAQPGPGPSGSSGGSTADTADPGSGRRTLGFVVGGVGAAGVVLGSIMGILTLGKKGTIDDNCDGPNCNAEGKEAADSAQTTGLVSTIGFAVGIAGLGAGAVLLLTAPSPKKEASPGRRFVPVAAAGPEGAVLGLKGAW